MIHHIRLTVVTSDNGQGEPTLEDVLDDINEHLHLMTGVLTYKLNDWSAEA